MSDHELRLDFNGTMRTVRDVPPLIWSPYASGEPPEPLDWRHDKEKEKWLWQLELERIRALIEVAEEKRNFTLMHAYEAHVEGARRNAAARKLFQHAFLQFPTDIKITPKSERDMLAHGVAFINRTYGGNAVFHARLDRDERGRHGVDVFFAPRYAKTTAKGTEDWISLSKFSKELARERFGQRQKTVKDPRTKKFKPVFDKGGKPVMVWNDSGYFQGRALQDAFFEHLRDVMGLEWAVRGTRKKTREDDWKTPEQIGAEKDLQRAQEMVVKARREAEEAEDRRKEAELATEAAERRAEAMAAQKLEVAIRTHRIASEGLLRALDGVEDAEDFLPYFTASVPYGGHLSRSGEQQHQIHQAVGPVIKAGFTALSDEPEGKTLLDRFNALLNTIAEWIDLLRDALPRFMGWTEVVEKVRDKAQHEGWTKYRYHTIAEVVELSPAWASLQKQATREIEEARTVAILTKAKPQQPEGRAVFKTTPDPSR